MNDIEIESTNCGECLHEVWIIATVNESFLTDDAEGEIEHECDFGPAHFLD